MRIPPTGLILACALGGLVTTAAGAISPDGIVYESEAISQPASAWEKDQRTGDRWMLWTRETDIEAKRSGGAVLASPVVEADRETPEDGAPPLHSVVTDLEPGTYLVFASNPGGRPLAYSLDGETWRKHSGSELALGAHHLPEGRFELWVDDRYAHPEGNPGPGYYDYLRFVRVPDSAARVKRLGVAYSLEERLRSEDDAFSVAAVDTSGWQGFAPDGDWLKAGRAGDQFEYEFDRAGTFYLAVSMVDDVDGMEQLLVRLNGEAIGCIVADTSGSDILFSFMDPVTVAPGDTLTFTCLSSVGYYRVGRLYFAPEFITPPPPAIQMVETWSPTPGVVEVCWTTDRIAETGYIAYGIGERTNRTERVDYEGRNHRIRLADLDPAQTYTGEVVTGHLDADITSEPFTFRAAPPELAASKPLEIPIAVPEPTGHARAAWPATIGMPFAEGDLARPGDLVLETPSGEPVPLQADTFSRWPDGSVKWATLSWLADTQTAGETTYTLRTADREAPATAPVLEVAETATGWRLRTDTLAFDVNRDAADLFDNVGYDRNGDGSVSDAERISPTADSGNLTLTDADGTVYTCGPPDAQGVVVERNGPVEALVTWSGPLVDGAGTPGWSYRVDLRLWKGLPAMAANVTVINDQAQPNFRAVTSLNLRVPLSGSDDPRGGFDGAPLQSISDGDPWRLLQDKDNRFSMHTADGGTEGNRADGVAVAADDQVQTTVVLRDFWETYPSGYTIGRDGVRVDMLPALPPDAYHGPEDADWYYKLYAWCRDGKYLLRAGQATRHEVLVHFGKPGGDTNVLADWLQTPLLPQAPPAYLCGTGALGRPIFPQTAGTWEDYERFFDESFENLQADRERRRTYGWMHFGDWYGERHGNFGNNEYALDWALGLQWMRTGDRRYYERGLEMAQHYATVDTMHGPVAEGRNGVVWTHCFNHTGTGLDVDELRIPEDDAGMAQYLDRYQYMLRGAVDRQGHIYEQGVWLYAALTGDPWLRDVAEAVSDNQAEKLTPNFNFTIERSGGWPLINAAYAYHFSGAPYYLNAARIMVERCFERQDPETGGWLHTPPRGETDNVAVRGGKAFAVGILTDGLLRYLDVEPEPRPDVRHMLVRGADWLMNEAWNPGKGFVYITNAPRYADTGRRDIMSALNAEVIAFAYEETGEKKYLDFWRTMMRDLWAEPSNGMGKAFTQYTRQTIFGLDRVLPAGVASSAGADENGEQ